ncbi:DNA-binding response regulator, partial [Sulfurimonas sp. RIFOXYB12_FULL_35_9]|uniref:response regulator transcription factor n=1 Tax=Sulfurimonas sp. RIFOXYB12_FULL_35_9 TaxID=1802256 RepID=UPI0025E89D37
TYMVNWSVPKYNAKYNFLCLIYTMRKIKILIIEDESILALELKNVLESAGYEVAGIASNSNAAITFVKSTNIDIIITDIQIKGELNGIQTVKLIHKIKMIPTIFLTAFHDDGMLKEVSKVNFTGYIVKPYLDEQLLREVRLTSLRYGLDGVKTVMEIGNGYRFNQNEKNLYLHDNIIELTKQELALIQLLIQNIGQIVSTEAIELMLWYDKAVSENSRRQLLFRLKAKLHGLNIETVKGVGYKLHKDGRR